jgi:hypothetical protein
MIAIEQGQEARLRSRGGSPVVTRLRMLRRSQSSSIDVHKRR